MNLCISLYEKISETSIYMDVILFSRVLRGAGSTPRLPRITV